MKMKFDKKLFNPIPIIQKVNNSGHTYWVIKVQYDFMLFELQNQFNIEFEEDAYLKNDDEMIKFMKNYYYEYFYYNNEPTDYVIEMIEDFINNNQFSIKYINILKRIHPKLKDRIVDV